MDIAKRSPFCNIEDCVQERICDRGKTAMAMAEISQFLGKRVSVVLLLFTGFEVTRVSEIWGRSD